MTEPLPTPDAQATQQGSTDLAVHYPLPGQQALSGKGFREVNKGVHRERSTQRTGDESP